MASENKVISNMPVKDDENSNILNALIDLYSEVFSIDEIKSVAEKCQWQMSAASSTLDEMFNSVEQNDGIIERNISPIICAPVTSNNNSLGMNHFPPQHEPNIPKNSFEPLSNLFSSAVEKSPPSPFDKTPPPTHLSPDVKQKRELDYCRIRNLIKTGAKVIVLLRGVPGSGKSYMAKSLIRDTVGDNSKRYIYSADDYFGEETNFYDQEPLKLPDAYSWNKRRVREVMRLGVSPVIVANPNLQIWEMKPYATFAVEFGYTLEILEPITPWCNDPVELASRNIHGINETKLTILLERYEKNITPEKLLLAYELLYMPRDYPPQPRLFPPLLPDIPPPLIDGSPRRIPNILSFQFPLEISKIKKKIKDKKKREGYNNANFMKQVEPVQEKPSQALNSDSVIDFRSADNYTVEKHDQFFGKDDFVTEVNTSKEFAVVKPKNDFLHQNNYENKAVEKVLTFKPRNLAKQQNENEYSNMNLNSWGLTNEAVVPWNAVEKKQVKTQFPLLQPQQSSSKLISKVDVSTNTCSTDFDLFQQGNGNEVRIVRTTSRIICQKGVNNGPRAPMKIAAFDKGTMTGQDCTLTGAIPRTRCSDDSQHFLELLQLFPTIQPDDLKEIYDKCQGDINWTVDLLLDANKDAPAPFHQASTAAKTAHPHNDKRNCAGQYGTQLYVKEIPTVGVKEVPTVSVKKISTVSLKEIPTASVKEIPTVSVKEIPTVSVKEIPTVSVKEIPTMSVKEIPTLSLKEIPTMSVKEIPTVSLKEIPTVSVKEIPIVSVKEKLSKPEIRKTPSKTKQKCTDEALQLKRELEEQIQIDETLYSPHVLNLRRRRHGDFHSEPHPAAEQPIPEITPQEIALAEEIDLAEQIEEIDFTDSSEEELIELNVGNSFVEELEKTFSGPLQLEYPKGLQPILQMPISLVAQIHTYWLDSIYSQMKQQNTILASMVREDEEFARRLQEQEENAQKETAVPNLQEIMDMEVALAIYRADQNQWTKETPDNLATRLKRQKLSESFPNVPQHTLNEIFQAHNYSFDITVDILTASLGPNLQINANSAKRQKELIDNAKQEFMQAKTMEAFTPKLVVKPLNVGPENNHSEEKSALYYRKQANHHLQMRQHCFNKANEAIQKGSHQVAMYYSDIAQMHKAKFETANNMAASWFLSANAFQLQDSKILDLHYLYLKEADYALSMFLDNQIILLNQKKKKRETLFIITGRGSHNKSGIAVIKPVVKRRLMERSIDFIELNPGLLKVSLRPHSILSKHLN